MTNWNDKVSFIWSVADLLEEQRELVSWLTGRLDRLGDLLRKIGASVEQLREYRTALISAAVTGKIDVSAT